MGSKAYTSLQALHSEAVPTGAGGVAWAGTGAWGRVISGRMGGGPGRRRD